MQQMAAQSTGGSGVRCPKCGRQLFAYKTETLTTRIIRYVQCRTPGCETRYRTRQSHQEIIEELNPRHSSSSGIAAEKDQ